MRIDAMKMKQSSESKKTKYYVRAIKRFIRLVAWVFILFVVIMIILWAAPKVWSWALG